MYSQQRKPHKASHPEESNSLEEHIEHEEPAEAVARPEERVQHIEAVVFAYICDAGVGEIAVPLVLDLGDLAAFVEDVDFAGDGGLFADALDFVEGGHVQLDGVAGGGDAVGFALDFGEGGLQAVL